MKPLRHWFRSTSCLKDFFFLPLNRTTSYFIPLAVCLSAYVMVLFTVIHFLFVVSTFLLFSSSRDRDGKAAKDEKGKDVFREGKKKFSGVLVFLILLLFGKHVY